MSALVSASVQAACVPESIRVMVVDDSALARGLMERWVSGEPDFEVVASLRSGREAVEWISRGEADVAVLDIDMPQLDGLSALPLMLAHNRDLVVIMASTITRRNAEVSLKALALGAADCIAKPETRLGAAAAALFRRELIDKIRLIGGRRRRWTARSQRRAQTTDLPPGGRRQASAHTLRAPSTKVPRALLVGASTGGPQALLSLLPQLQRVAESAPILVVQHMPPTFTTIFAEHVGRACGLPAREAVDGESVLRGRIYIAPGGRHMRVAARAGCPVIEIDDGPPINFCKPAVDRLFETASQVWGGRALAVILTGMGRDGTRGAGAIVAAGGTIIAQDESTSTVWGMPGSATSAGLCSAVLPLDRMAAEIGRMFAKGSL